MEQQRAVELMGICFMDAAAVVLGLVAWIPQRILPLIFGADASRRAGPGMVAFVRFTAGMSSLGGLADFCWELIDFLHR
jgi:hypothetical protein